MVVRRGVPERERRMRVRSSVARRTAAGERGTGGAAAFPVAMYHQGAGSSAARPRRMRKRGILRRTDMWFMVPFRMARGKGYCLIHGNRLA